MGRKTSVIFALTSLVAHVGLPITATGQEALLVDERCRQILEMNNREVLQQELEFLLDRDPDDPCIPLIVSRLGGAPLAALIAQEPY